MGCNESSLSCSITLLVLCHGLDRSAEAQICFSSGDDKIEFETDSTGDRTSGSGVVVVVDARVELEDSADRFAWLDGGQVVRSGRTSVSFDDGDGGEYSVENGRLSLNGHFATVSKLISLADFKCLPEGGEEED